MKLYERLPDSVIVNGKRVKVDLDFRNVLRMLEILERSDLMPEAREYLAAKCICKRPKNGVISAVKALLFPPVKVKGERARKPVTSYEQDAWMIRAAFRQCYGIDLWREKLHWLEFADLIHALPEGNRYIDTIGIRVRELPAPTKYNAKEREWLIKAKASVALEIPEEERMTQYENDVVNIFNALLPHAREVNPDE